MPRKSFKKASDILLLFLVLVSANLFTGCNEEPTEISYNLLYDTLSIYPISSLESKIIESATPYKNDISLLNVGYLLIGKSGETKALSIIRFQNIPDTLSYLKTSNIDSVVLRIYPKRYIFGDSSLNNLSFNIHKVNNLWTTSTTWDSLYEVPNYFDSKVLGSYSKKIGLTDTLPITMHLDKDLIVEWFQLQPDTNITVVNYGIALIPDESSNVIRQFSAQAVGDSVNHPIIYVYCKDSTGTSQVIELTSAMDASFTTAPKPNADDIVVQGAVTYRTELAFDLTSLPTLASIHAAKLYLTMNVEKTKVGNYGIDYYIMAELIDTTVDDDEIPQYVASRDSLPLQDYLYKFNNINSSVEWWLRHDKKGKLSIFCYGYEAEVGRIDRLTFYGLKGQDTTKLPVLKIIYSIRDFNCNNK